MEVLQPYQPKNAKIKIEVCETQRSKRTPCFAGILGFSNFSNRNQARAYKLYESTFHKEGRLKRLTQKVNTESGVTFKP